MHGSEAVNPALAELVQARLMPGNPGLSNVGGLRTPSDLLRVDHPAILCLRTWIFEAVATLFKAVMLGFDAPDLSTRMTAEAWGNLCDRGDYQQPHIHHGSIWSGVYYVDSLADCQASGGVLELHDPRAGAWLQAKSQDAVHRIVPRPGLLVAFPSWLSHSVTPVTTSHRRISIAFNSGLRPSDGVQEDKGA